MTTRARRWLVLALLLAGIGIALYYRDRLSVEALITWVGQLGWLAPLAFMAAYSVATVFFLPGVLFTLAGGVLFGPWLGTLYSLTGATIGASLAFLIARYLARDWVAQRAGTRLRQLIDGVDTEGWRFIAFVRLVPLIPFNLLNYALGLTRIPLVQYVLTSFLFMAPGGAAYTYLGYAGREAAAGNGGDVVRKLLLALAIVATIAFVSHLLLRWRRHRGGA